MVSPSHNAIISRLSCLSCVQRTTSQSHTMSTVVNYCTLLFLVFPTRATDHTVNQNLGPWIQNRLENIVTGQNSLRSKIPAWDQHLNSISLKLDTLDQRLTQIELGTNTNHRQKQAGWKEAYLDKFPMEELVMKIVAQLLQQKWRPELNVLGLGLQTLTESVQGLQESLDDLLEKFLRLADQSSQNNRQILQGINQIHEAVTESLKISAALKTESVAESRRLARVFDAKTTQLQFRLEKALQPPLIDAKVTGTDYQNSDKSDNIIDKLLGQMEQILTKCAPSVDKSEKVESQSYLEYTSPKNKRSHVTRPPCVPPNCNNYNAETTTGLPNIPTRKLPSIVPAGTQQTHAQFAYPVNSIVVRVGGKHGASGSARRHQHENQATAPFGKQKTLQDLKNDFEEEEEECCSKIVENMTAIVEKSEERMLQHIGHRISLFTTKVSNMYEELWKSDRSMATEIQILAAVVNSTKWDMDDGFRTLVNGNIHNTNSPSSGVNSNDQNGPILRRLSAMEARLEGHLNVLVMMQESLSENCHLREKDAHTETTVYDALNKIAQFITNKTGEEPAWGNNITPKLLNGTVQYVANDTDSFKADMDEILRQFPLGEEHALETDTEDSFNNSNLTDYSDAENEETVAQLPQSPEDMDLQVLTENPLEDV